MYDMEKLYDAFKLGVYIGSFIKAIVAIALVTGLYLMAQAFAGLNLNPVVTCIGYLAAGLYAGRLLDELSMIEGFVDLCGERNILIDLVWLDQKLDRFR